MTIRKRGAGWCYDFLRQGVRHTRSGFPTAEAAADAESVHKATLVDIRLQREYGIRPPRGRVPTVRTFLTETYLPSLTGRLGDGTSRRVRTTLLRFVDWLGPASLLDVTRETMERWRTARAATLATNSLRLEFARLKGFFRAALEAGHLRENPARIKLPGETRGPDRILTDAEEARLLAAFRSQTMRDACEFALWTSLRPGELCGLTGAQVDLPGGRLLVQQPKVGRPKSIPLMPEAVAILLRQPQLAHDAPVFRGALRGRHILVHVYRRAFQRAVTVSGIPAIRPNDLRHTTAVRLIRAGADLATVGDILGHKPPYRTTARYLAHTSEDRKRDVMSRLSRTHKAPARPYSQRQTRPRRQP